MLRLIALVIPLLLSGVAQAGEPTGVTLRTGEHAGFGRVVFDLPSGVTAADPVREGDRLRVHIAPAVSVADGARAPRNVRGIATKRGEADLTLVPGARVRPLRMGGKLVIDVLDPPVKPVRSQPTLPVTESSTATSAAKGIVTSPPAGFVASPSAILIAADPAPAAITPAVQISAAPPPDSRLSALPENAIRPADMPAVPVLFGSPMQLAATPVLSRPDAPGPGLLLPFDEGVGAAAFRRGDEALVVFDARKPIDMAPLQGDPVFASAVVQLLPAGTLLRFKLPSQIDLQLQHGVSGWTVTTAPAVVSPGMPIPAMQHPIVPKLMDGVMNLTAGNAGKIVSVPDPQTGRMLLVGTQRQPGENLATLRGMPEFALLPTWQGVALEPISDVVAVIAKPPGFVIEAAAGGKLALSAPSAEAITAADAVHFSRRFDFPAMPVSALRRRLLEAVQAAAATPLQARAVKRMVVAQAMLALGMGVEAQSTLKLAAAGDGRLADDPDVIGLAAIAAMMASRPTEAAGVDDPRLSGTDEIALWRAVRGAMVREGAPEAAPVFAANLPLLLSYPRAIRYRLLPLAAETMAMGGERAAALQLIDSRPDDRGLDLARGLLAESAPALEMMERLAQGPDRLIRARAATAAVELQLANSSFSAAQAADALDSLMYSWRGDGRELALRIREAELRRQAGQWRAALALARETEQIWPDQRSALQAGMVKTFAEALAQDETTPLAPLDLVALVAENGDLIPKGDIGEGVAGRLSDRLVALDLPGRAIPLLEKLTVQAPAGPVKAALGGRVAALHMDQGEFSAALGALTRSAAPDLPVKLLESRTLSFARAAAAAGDLPSAVAALAALATPAANLLRADLLEGSKDWPAVEAALREVVATSIPAAGALDKVQGRVMLRLASAAAQAGDERGLKDLRDQFTGRLPPGKSADLFRLLTEGPVSGVADLPRAARETKLAGSLSADLKSVSR